MEYKSKENATIHTFTPCIVSFLLFYSPSPEAGKNRVVISNAVRMVTFLEQLYIRTGNSDILHESINLIGERASSATRNWSNRE